MLKRLRLGITTRTRQLPRLRLRRQAHSLTSFNTRPTNIRALSSSTAHPPEKLSSVHKGTQFERRAQRLLQTHFSMALYRTGGKADGGVDLTGWWWLPDVFEGAGGAGESQLGLGEAGNASAAQVRAQVVSELGLTGGQLQREDPHRTTTTTQNLIRIRVLAQCKAERKKLGPNYIRELEGTFLRYAYLTRGGDAGHLDALDAHESTSAQNFPSHKLSGLNLATAVLISESAFTRASIERVMSSHVPFLLIHLPRSDPPTSGLQHPSPPEDNQRNEEGQIGGAIWNTALAGRDGVLRGALELRWERALTAVATATNDGRSAGRPGLWWNGGRLGNYVPDEMR